VRIGVIPVINLVCIIFYALVLGRLMYKFNDSYMRQPLLTMMATNVLLYGLSDTLAQTLTSARLASNRGRTVFSMLFEKNGDGEFTLRDLHLPETATAEPRVIPMSMVNIPVFSFQRLARFTVWGFILSPFQYNWFNFLEWMFPMTERVFVPALKRVATDQLLYSPVSLAAFFAYSTISTGGGYDAVCRKMKLMFLPTMKVLYMVWPLAQLINFCLVPLKFQIPFSSTVGIFWNAYLSLADA
ncbi:hypothetical protein CANCADRAFT_11323, partial [Tortispora caseinolytica NRRL Y-17796]